MGSPEFHLPNKIAGKIESDFHALNFLAIRISVKERGHPAHVFSPSRVGKMPTLLEGLSASLWEW